MAITVGSWVRFQPQTPPSERNFNSTMQVQAITGNTAACTRETKPCGTFLLSDLVDVGSPDVRERSK